MNVSKYNLFFYRRIKFDSIDVHPVEKALIVFYRIEAVLLSQDGEAVAGEKRVHIHLSAHQVTLALNFE
jgi:hypothetical protein